MQNTTFTFMENLGFTEVSTDTNNEPISMALYYKKIGNFIVGIFDGDKSYIINVYNNNRIVEKDNLPYYIWWRVSVKHINNVDTEDIESSWLESLEELDEFVSYLENELLICYNMTV